MERERHARRRICSRRVAHPRVRPPLVAAAAFVSPLARDPLGLDAAAVAVLRPAALLAAAMLLLMLSVPFLVQGHLNGALVAWYELKFGGHHGGRETPRSARARLIREVTSHVAVKVAVQAAAPAALMACRGVPAGREAPFGVARWRSARSPG